MKPNTDSPAERAQLLAERDAARAHADEVERRCDELLSRVAHDLRGPLNAIFGWVQLLQCGGLDADRQRRALEAIARGVRSQTELLDEMQRASHVMQSGESSPTRPVPRYSMRRSDSGKPERDLAPGRLRLDEASALPAAPIERGAQTLRSQRGR